MIKATTSHGTYYLIDEENKKAIRVPPYDKKDVPTIIHSTTKNLQL